MAKLDQWINPIDCCQCGNAIEAGDQYIYCDDGNVFCSWECYENWAVNYVTTCEKVWGEDEW